MRSKLKLALVIGAAISALNLHARENVGNGPQKQSQSENKSLAASCDPGVGRSELNINNVRCTIFTSGDMWWDLNTTARYEIPKGSNKHSMFASALWIGGVDNGGNLKVAAMTYRQTGNDFWPGPLDTTTASIDVATCAQYDRHWKVTRAEVEEFVANCGNPGYDVPDDIETWPGNGDPGLFQSKYLAPFRDLNNNGVYEVFNCEYPDYDITGTLGCQAQLYGDQTLWWVFNDKGNVHSETGGLPIGIEVHAQAFAFSTNDEVNNMTFYKYKIFNRSSFTVEDCYFGQWVDSDLGKYNDDYVGCDVTRGLGFTYNGDADDDGQFGYGINPPAAGLDFFEGPRADDNDGIDNDRDGVIDEIGELIIMSKFVYYNNDFSITGNPENAQHIYNYLRARWKDNTPMVYNGTNGYGSGTPCDFIFPESSDQTFGWGTGGTPSNPTVQAPWDETTAGNTPADRRFLQSAGAFTLEPGAINNITVGAVWARATSGGPRKSVELLKLADDKAQSLFDNCFRLVEGPRSPDVHMVELPNELVLELNSTNVPENYIDSVKTTNNLGQPVTALYEFQGYQIYQLKTANVTQVDLDNPDLARLIAQVDVEDATTQIVNRYFDATVSDYIPVEEVNGENKGIKHTFSITDDAFAIGATALVNHKTYYYMVIAYGFSSQTGVLEPYLPGKKNFDGKAIQVHAGIPHINTPKEDGTDLGAGYAGGPRLKRIEGQGNGGLVLDLTPETEDLILQNGYVREPIYMNGKGPVAIKVIDPIRVPQGEFILKLDSSKSASPSGVVDGTTKWSITNTTTNETIYSDRDITIPNEQILLLDRDNNGKITPDERWGFSVNWVQVPNAGSDTASATNGVLESTIKFDDVSRQWLGFIRDEEGSFDPRNWIRSGTYKDAANPEWNDYPALDNLGAFENMLDGAFAPYRVCARDNTIIGTPAWNNAASQALASFGKLASIELVITPDKSKWTRCPVVELNNDPATSEGGAKKMDCRNRASVDKNGNPGDGIVTNDPNDADFISAKGMGWFPGYAINVETGERLTIMFGENSFLTQDNGRDMKWNPTSRVFNGNNVIMGGMHYVYIMGRNVQPNPVAPLFDNGAHIMAQLSTNNYVPTDQIKRNVYKDAMYVTLPVAVDGKDWLSNNVRIRLRVAKAYSLNYSVDAAGNPVNDNYPQYYFNTDDIFANTNNGDAAKRGLDLINIVPNPYYAFSAYERNQLDNRVKITNLPQKATISIFTLNGTLIRRFKKDDPLTSLDWDLKNQTAIPIASGLYIIHIDVPGVGEKVLKWFGVMRPIDLDTF
jgi:hypothetical protein